MAKESGLSLTVTIDDYLGAATAISNDVTNLSFEIPSGVQDTSGVNYSANERLLLRADMSVTLNGVFNPTGSHLIFENFRTVLAGQVGRTTSIAVSGQILADELLFGNYALALGAGGELTWSVPGDMSDGTLTGWS